MSGARFVGVVAALLLFSGFMPWFDIPFSDPFIPVEHAGRFAEVVGEHPELLEEMPASVILFILTFGAAALLAFTGVVMDQAPRLLAMATGAAPFVAIAIEVARLNRVVGGSPFAGDLGRVSRAASEAASGRDAFSREALGRLWDIAGDAFGQGVMLFFAAALTLLMVSMILPSRSDR